MRYAMLGAFLVIVSALIAPLIAPALIIQAIRLRRWPWIVGACVTSLAYAVWAISLWTSPDPKAWVLFGDTLWLPIVGLAVGLIAMLQYPVRDNRKAEPGPE